MIEKIKQGDLIGINAKGNTHGCRDYAIAMYTGGGVAVVIESESCHSCWQVGHDTEHVFMPIGERIDISTADICQSDGVNWSTSILWEIQ